MKLSRFLVVHSLQNQITTFKKRTAMELSTKERQQCNAKRNHSRKSIQARLRRVTKKAELNREKCEELSREVERLLFENQQLRKRLPESEPSCTLGNDSSPLERFCHERGLRYHKFGARMIALCINLAKWMSFRSIPKALRLIFDTLGLSIEVPAHDSIEHWCKRVGLDAITRSEGRHEGGLWMVDHSNQIGQEKVLVILGTTIGQLPPPGETLSLDKLDVLAIVPGTSWKRDDVRCVYREVAKRCGTPRFVVCDGAVELRETVDVLETSGKTVAVLRDFKHFAANRFEKLVGNSERFKSFCAQMGKTRCQVQQTELSHLTPPSLKTKARFMNITPVVRWGCLIVFLLENPDNDVASDTERSRLREKIGWVEEYRDELATWARCCDVIEASLHWINTQGLDSDSAVRMDEHLASSRDWVSGSLEKRLRDELVAFVHEHAEQLQAGERAWLSSEALESAFGRYKCREFQHSRSGFTGLIITLPSLLRAWTAEQVRESLARVTNSDVRSWISEQIGPTVAGRRARAYRKLRRNQKSTRIAA